MKRVLSVLLALILCLGMLAACSSQPSSDPSGTNAPADTGTDKEETKDPIVLRLATTDGEEWPTSQACLRFAEEVEKATNGAVKVQVYLSGQLGDYTQNFEELMRGSLDMACIAISTSYDDRLNITRIPYLFENYEQVNTYMSEGTYYFEQLNGILNDLGIELISNWPNGFQGIGGAKVGSLDTLFDPTIKQEGAICRVPSIETTLKTAEAFGFQTVTVAYSDLYSALQTGVATCWMGGGNKANYDGFRDVINYWVEARYILETQPLLVSASVWEKIPEEYQRAIRDAAAKEFTALLDERPAIDEQALKDLKEYGIEVYIPSDDELASFAGYIRENVWPELENMFGAEFYHGLMKEFGLE